MVDEIVNVPVVVLPLIHAQASRLLLLMLYAAALLRASGRLPKRRARDGAMAA